MSKYLNKLFTIISVFFSDKVATTFSRNIKRGSIEIDTSSLNCGFRLLKGGNSFNRRAKLAGRGTSQNYFDGFFLGEEVDKEYVEALKTRLDSLKRAMLYKKKHSKITQ